MWWIIVFDRKNQILIVLTHKRMHSLNMNGNITPILNYIIKQYAMKSYGGVEV
jgi:uncharacterized protein YhbP (UPF0306 family)